MTALSVLIIGLAFLQQPVKEAAAWVPQRIEDLKYPRLANHGLVQGTGRNNCYRKWVSSGCEGSARSSLLADAALKIVKRWTFRKNERLHNSTDINSTTLTYVFKLEGLTPGDS